MTVILQEYSFLKISSRWQPRSVIQYCSDLQVLHHFSPQDDSLELQNNDGAIFKLSVISMIKVYIVNSIYNVQENEKSSALSNY